MLIFARRITIITIRAIITATVTVQATSSKYLTAFAADRVEKAVLLREFGVRQEL
jgi:hypothetical protein